MEGLSLEDRSKSIALLRDEPFPNCHAYNTLARRMCKLAPAHTSKFTCDCFLRAYMNVLRSSHKQLQPLPSLHPLTRSRVMRRDLMERTAELKERREATDCANTEFNRVKRAKLENERAKSRLNGTDTSAYDEKAVKQLDRERANRASAAASRAKIVCYARELEKRTDRLERDRNAHALRAEKAIKRLKSLRDESKRLKEVLRNLWQLKDPKTCSYLVDSNALFLLADNDRDGLDDIDDDLKPPPRTPIADEKKLNTSQPDYYPSVLPPPPPSQSAQSVSLSPVPTPAQPATSIATSTTTQPKNSSHSAVLPAEQRTYQRPLPALVHHNPAPPPPPPQQQRPPPLIPPPPQQPHYHPVPPPAHYPYPPPPRQPYVLAPPVPRCSTTTDIYAAAPAPLVAAPRPPLYYTAAPPAPVIPPIRVPGEPKREITAEHSSSSQQQQSSTISRPPPRPQLPPLP